MVVHEGAAAARQGAGQVLGPRLPRQPPHGDRSDDLDDRAGPGEDRTGRAAVPVRASDPDDPELGATTAEYGIVMLAAVGFAGLLVVILKSDQVRGLLMNIIETALSTG